MYRPAVTGQEPSGDWLLSKKVQAFAMAGSFARQPSAVSAEGLARTVASLGRSLTWLQPPSGFCRSSILDPACTSSAVPSALRQQTRSIAD